jgi:predicted secreted protein
MLRHIGAMTALAVSAMLFCTPTLAQTWEYKSYKKSLGGQYTKENFVVGSISLQEKDGKATFYTNAGVMDACRRAEVPAQVTRTDAEITIEPEISLAGCEKFRLVIRNDGSGGRREVWRNEKWVDTKWDHGLTPKK